MPLPHINPADYSTLFATKVDRVRPQFATFSPPQARLFASPPLHFRLRAEFRVWHDGDDLFYAMFDPKKPKDPIRVSEFPIASVRITETMQPLLEAVRGEPTLRRKLFQIEFLSTLSDELLITLVYHRPLDSSWQAAAETLSTTLACSVIGRSKKQKLCVGQDFVTETLTVGDAAYCYRQPEQCFTQPNGHINEAMIQWLLAHCREPDTDLLELYCGVGNFTLPLASRFRRVLATELNKRATAAALDNVSINQIHNIELARLSAAEISEAMTGARAFRRLAHLHQPLAEYRFNTLLVDPPRAGLDPQTLQLAAQFDRILYISCNPESLLENLSLLSATHDIEALAFFDQFPYTDHLETGVSLTRKSQ